MLCFLADMAQSKRVGCGNILMRSLRCVRANTIHFSSTAWNVFVVCTAVTHTRTVFSLLQAMVVLGMGSCSSFCGQIMAYPLQLIRTKLQSSGLPGRPVYTGVTDVVKQVWEQGGPRGFYRGIVPNFMKGIPVRWDEPIAVAVAVCCFYSLLPLQLRRSGARCSLPTWHVLTSGFFVVFFVRLTRLSLLVTWLTKSRVPFSRSC